MIGVSTVWMGLLVIKDLLSCLARFWSWMCGWVGINWNAGQKLLAGPAKVLLYIIPIDCDAGIKCLHLAL